MTMKNMYVSVRHKKIVSFSYPQWVIKGLGGPLTEVELVGNFWLLFVSF